MCAASYQVKQSITLMMNIVNDEKLNIILSENDRMRYEMDAYSELIRENIELDILRERHPYDQDLLEGIFDLILETVLCKNESIIIASNKYPAELVRSNPNKSTV